MSNHTDTQGAVDPQRAVLALFLIPSLATLVISAVAFVLYALHGHMALLWIPAFIVLLYGIGAAIEIVFGWFLS